MIRRLVLVLLLCAGLPLCAQTSNVTAQITDSDGTAWVNGSCTVTAVYKQQSPIVAPYLNSGGNVPLNPSCAVNGSGQLSTTVTDVKFIAPVFFLTWQFTVCPNISQQAGKSACGVTQIPVTGANPSLTGQLNLPAPRIGGGVGAFAYADIEVSPVYNNFYWNIISNTCRQFGTGWAQCATGGGSTGTVNNGAAWQLTYYPGAGNTVGPAPNLWMLNPSASSATVSTFIATLTAGQDVVLIPPSFPQIPFTNTNYVEMIDMRPVAMTVQMGSAGIPCDGAVSPLSLTLVAGQTSYNIGALPGFGAGVTVTVGQRTGYGATALQQTWTSKIISNVAGNITFSSATPFTYFGRAISGTDNTAAIQQLFNLVGSTPIYIPYGCHFLTGPLAWNNSQTIVGKQRNDSGFISKPGFDILQQPDASGAGSAGEGQISNIDFILDSPVDPTLPINDYDMNGTLTVRPPLYRPTHMAPEALDANNPCAPGWFTNCQNAVASIAQGSALLCTPNALGRLPAVGQVVVIPYQTAVFTSTIASNAGSCPSGSTARTMVNALPNTSGYNSAQAEYFYGSAVQQITTNIPANPTFPLTVNLSLPTQPVPGFLSNFSADGHVRFGTNECDYIGNGGYGSQIVLRGCNTISSGYTAPITVVPTNPCSAKNQFYAASDQPWPVLPNLNSGDSTPSGAGYFPGRCVGAAAISFPQANGNVFNGGGLVGGILTQLDFDGDPQTPQNLNGTAPYYSAGNTGSYQSEFGNWNVNYYEFGPVQGPASAGQHGVAAVGPTGASNSWHDMVIQAAHPLTFDDMQNSKIERIYTNSTWFNPYDGTPIGPGVCLFLGYTQDEQTGAGATINSFNKVDTWGCEPENGSHIGVLPAHQLDQFNGLYLNANFEGGFTEVGGTNQWFSNTTIFPPLLNTGVGNHFVGLGGNPIQYITNVWPNGYLDWGTLTDCSYIAGGTAGPLVPCFPGSTQPASGRTIDASVAGSKFENPQNGIISPGEWNISFLFDTNPMANSNVIDPTEPFVGRYAGCNLGGSALCQPSHFDGFTGFIMIGNNNRLTDTAYDIVADFKSATASGQVTLTISAIDPGTGTCSSPGVVASYTIPTTTSWPSVANVWKSPTPANFAGKSGCAFSPTFGSATTTDQYRVGKFDLYPVPNQIPLPLASPTVGASCLGPNAIIGANSSGPLSCFGGVVVQGAGSSPFQSLTTTGSNCALSTLISGILNIPPCSPSGSSGFPFTLGGTTITAGGSFSSIASLALTSSSVNGVTPSTAGPNTQYLDKTGNYSTPAGSGTQTICSTTITLSGSLTSGTQGSVGSGTCAGAQTSPQDVVTCSTPTNIFTVAPFQPSTSGTPTLAIQVTTNTITINAANNLTTTQTFSGPTYTCRIFR